MDKIVLWKKLSNRMTWSEDQNFETRWHILLSIGHQISSNKSCKAWALMIMPKWREKNKIKWIADYRCRNATFISSQSMDKIQKLTGKRFFNKLYTQSRDTLARNDFVTSIADGIVSDNDHLHFYDKQLTLHTPDFREFAFGFHLNVFTATCSHYSPL